MRAEPMRCRAIQTTLAALWCAGAAAAAERLPAHAAGRVPAAARALDDDAHAELARGAPLRALELIDRALALAPSPALLLDRALLEHRLEQFREAAADCLRLAREFPDSEEALAGGKLAGQIEAGQRRKEALEALRRPAGAAPGAQAVPAAPAVQQQGGIEVVATAGGQPVEGAEVWVRGERRGTLPPAGPLTVDGIPEGPAAVEVRAPLHEPWRREVAIAVGPRTRLAAELEARYGFLEAKADQPASVELDGKALGPADGRRYRVPIGPHRVALAPAAPARYRVHEQAVTVGALRSVQVDARLAPRLGRLVVRSTPAGAQVSAGGKEAGKTPATLELFAGAVPLRLELEERQPWTGEGVIREGETTSVDVVLKQKPSYRTAILLGVGAVLLGAGGAAMELRAHSLAGQQADALARYGAATDQASFDAARADATSATSSTRQAQAVAIGLAVAAGVLAVLAVVQVGSAP